MGANWEWLKDLAGWAALIGLALTWWKLRKTLPAEAAKADAEAAKAYMEAANLAAKRAIDAELNCSERDLKIEGLEQRVAALEQERDEQKRYIVQLNQYITGLLAGIERLIHQLQSHDLTPDWKPNPMKAGKGDLPLDLPLAPP